MKYFYITCLIFLLFSCEKGSEIINNNNNSNLEMELNSIAKEILKNSGKNKLDDDLTVLTIGK